MFLKKLLSAFAQLSESVATDTWGSFCSMKDIQKAPHFLQVCAPIFKVVEPRRNLHIAHCLF